MTDTLLMQSIRSADLAKISGLAQKFAARESLEIFRRICTSRYFELETARVYETGVIKMPIYLSVGEENVPAAISVVSTDFRIFAQHRAHSYYLSFGGDKLRLIDELLHRETGCARGMGGSASIHDPAIGMYGHSGLMGDQIPIAVGMAVGSGKSVLAVMGDASGEEDYVIGAMAYAATKKAPVLFVCEDNDLSILTPISTRRSWDIAGVARSVGLPAVDIADDPWLIAHHTQELLPRLPAFINVRTCRHLWHAGVGNDGAPEWDRFSMVKKELGGLGLAQEAERIESEAKEEIAQLWHKQLQKP